MSTTRDNATRPTRVTAKTSSGAVTADVGYSYTASGGGRSVIQTLTAYVEQGVTAGAVTSYSYDASGRLSNATETSGATTTAAWGYTYNSGQPHKRGSLRRIRWA